jgi:hypothetical protein
MVLAHLGKQNELESEREELIKRFGVEVNAR